MPAGGRKYARRPSATKAKAKPKMTLEKKIKAITLSEQEQKIKTWQVFNSAEPTNYGLKIGSNALGLIEGNILGGSIFSMQQGTSQQQRIGNSINNCKLNVKGYVYSLPVSAPSNSSVYPFELHILVYKAKNDVTGDPNDLLQYPNNTNGNITGDIQTTLYPFNRKAYTIKAHKVIRLKGNPTLATSQVPTAIGVENPAFYGATDQFSKRFSVDINIKDVLTFDDTGVIPANEWCSMAAYVINGDGAVIVSGAAQKRCKVTAFATLRYKDS